MAPQGLLSWWLAKAMHSAFDIIFVLLSQGKHKKMILKIPSNPNHSMTLWYIPGVAILRSSRVCFVQSSFPAWQWVGFKSTLPFLPIRRHIDGTHSPHGLPLAFLFNYLLPQIEDYYYTSLSEPVNYSQFHSSIGLLKYDLLVSQTLRQHLGCTAIYLLLQVLTAIPKKPGSTSFSLTTRVFSVLYFRILMQDPNFSGKFLSASAA